jgi:hypothetical protein
MRYTTAAALAIALTTVTIASAQQKPAPPSTPKPTAAKPKTGTKTAGKPAQTQADADKATKGTGKLPVGWKGRFDSPETKETSLTVASEGPSMKFTTGPDAAGIYDRPDMKATGNYELSAAFSQLKPSEHAEAYGLFIGGTDLDKPSQHYTYFLVRQDGKYSIRSRNGEKTAAIVDWTDAAPMKDPKGTKTSNTLAIRSQADGVHFLIGGKEVQKLTRAQASPDGIAGLRVNHSLNVQVDKLLLKPSDVHALNPASAAAR